MQLAYDTIKRTKTYDSLKLGIVIRLVLMRLLKSGAVNTSIKDNPLSENIKLGNKIRTSSKPILVIQHNKTKNKIRI